MVIYPPDHELVLNGTYDQEGYKPGERARIAKARARQLTEQSSSAPKGHPMFQANTPATLTDVTFTTEEVDDETRRVVVATFALSPFTPAQAEALNVRSLLFEAATSLPKAALDTIILLVSVPLQRLTLAMAPDQGGGLVFEDVQVTEKLRVKAKRDRDPVVVDATFKVNFRYPDAADLLALANSVNDTMYLSFDQVQGDLLTTEAQAAATPPKRGRKAQQPPIQAGDDLGQGRHAEH